jgi:hypothetical protein
MSVTSTPERRRATGSRHPGALQHPEVAIRIQVVTRLEGWEEAAVDRFPRASTKRQCALPVAGSSVEVSWHIREASCHIRAISGWQTTSDGGRGRRQTCRSEGTTSADQQRHLCFARRVSRCEVRHHCRGNGPERHCRNRGEARPLRTQATFHLVILP